MFETQISYQQEYATMKCFIYKKKVAIIWKGLEVDNLTILWKYTSDWNALDFYKVLMWINAFCGGTPQRSYSLLGWLAANLQSINQCLPFF
jgi:hypothetical protein